MTRWDFILRPFFGFGVIVVETKGYTWKGIALKRENGRDQHRQREAGYQGLRKLGIYVCDRQAEARMIVMKAEPVSSVESVCVSRDGESEEAERRGLWDVCEACGLLYEGRLLVLDRYKDGDGIELYMYLYFILKRLSKTTATHHAQRIPKSAALSLGCALRYLSRTAAPRASHESALRISPCCIVADSPLKRPFARWWIIFPSSGCG